MLQYFFHIFDFKSNLTKTFPECLHYEIKEFRITNIFTNQVFFYKRKNYKFKIINMFKIQ